MDDIFTLVREGNAFQVRIWLDNTENDLNQGDDHQFSLLHWAAMKGQENICEMLLDRGVRVNSTNMGEDTPLHLASAHGHLNVVQLLLQNKASVGVSNEHGNTPLHYACFWNYQRLAEELVRNNASVNIENKYKETPLEKAHFLLARELRQLALSLGQGEKREEFRDRSWLGYRTRTKGNTLARNSGIDLDQLNIQGKLLVTHTAELYKGYWGEDEVIIKLLNVGECSARKIREFKSESQKLRIFNHQNILPVLGTCIQPPSLVLISQFMPLRSLYDLLHSENAIPLDNSQNIDILIDVAKGMEFLHNLQGNQVAIDLNSKHILLDEDLTARINLSSFHFPFHQPNMEMSPAWMSPEALQKPLNEINKQSADMWSFAIIIWEIITKRVPFSGLGPMEIGMKVALEGLRVSIPDEFFPHLARLMKICMNEESGKRPKFDMVVPILNKMKSP